MRNINQFQVKMESQTKQNTPRRAPSQTNPIPKIDSDNSQEGRQRL